MSLRTVDFESTASTNSDLAQLLKERIVFLDGAMGTMIQRYDLQEKDFRGTAFQTIISI